LKVFTNSCGEPKFLDGRSERDIDAQVARVLRGLGNPEPPLDLDAVRELLRLARPPILLIYR